MTTFGPCENWPVLWTCDVTTESPVVTGRAATAATEWLWSLSGRRYGECQLTYRPCRRECRDFPWPATGWSEWPSGTWPQPALVGGLWYNLTCGVCGPSCACARLSEVLLPDVISRVVLVRLDGAPMVTGAYRVDDSRVLVRTDGGEWPRCQDLNKADTQVGTWSVTVRLGREVPLLGQLAAGEVGCEVIRALNGFDCRLPANVTQLVRQGVTLSMPDPSARLKDGLTGLTWTDRFIQSVNPGRLQASSRVYDVDASRHRRAGTA